MSPFRSWLYRRPRWAVICALLALSLAPKGVAQLARKAKQEKGPRALGLVELSSDGSARLIPITIMVDGKFYDAGAYKASPVPLALWNQTVYEAEKTGVSQGLFTVSEAMRVGDNTWFGQGKWRPAGSEPKPKHAVSSKPRMEEEEGPPKLRRPAAEKPDASAPKPEAPAPSTTSTQDDKKPSAPAPGNPPSSPPSSDAGSAPPQPKPSDEAASSNSNDEDPNRPVLKRGKPETEGVVHPGASTGVPRRPAGAAANSEAKKTPPQQIPAISDAAGPEPRPYSYDIKPDEEQKYRKGMLALAADAVRARLKETAPVVAPAKPPGRSAHSAVKATQPTFDDVQFRAFDLWNTNEPVFILSATAHLAKTSASPDAGDMAFYVTLVAKKNIYDELRKLYAGVTDVRHLDETPRMQLIDAVDADGDGRGELLFRRITDAGNSYGVYRAAADSLFPLFESTPNGH